MLQLTQENKSLWRIKNHYMGEAEGNDECLIFWRKMVESKENHIAELVALVKKNID